MWYAIGAIAVVVIVVMFVKALWSPKSTSTGRTHGHNGRDFRADDPRLTRYTRPDGGSDYYPSSWRSPDDPGGSLDI